MTALAERSRGTTLWRYRRPFHIDGLDFQVTLWSCTDGLHSELSMLGVPVAQDRTPLGGPEAIRNHRLDTQLPDGRSLSVEAGYISALNTGIAVRLDGALVHESHPGRTIAYPEKYREQALAMTGCSFGEAVKAGYQQDMTAKGYDPHVWQRNRLPLTVDIGLTLMFFVVSKLTNLMTGALSGAAAVVVLYGVQRRTGKDLLGGLAVVGVIMTLISAGLAWVFQDDDAIKLRSTIMGLLGAGVFLTDGLLAGGRLGKRLMRYLPYTDIIPKRLSIGMGVMGLVMAGLNVVVVELVSTDVWLFYTTFVDFALAMALIMVVFAYARGRLFAGAKVPG